MPTGSAGRSAGDTLHQELRRGALVLAVLAVLRHESYGAAIQTSLADAGVTIDIGALYPMLRRLESQGLLTSTWRHEEARNRRMYRTSNVGKEVLSELLAELESMTSNLRNLAEGKHGSH